MTTSLAVLDDGVWKIADFHDGPDHTRFTSEVTRLTRKAFSLNPLDPFDQIKNLGLYAHPVYTARLLFLNDMYRAILDVPGVVVEFGVRYGRDLVTLQHLRLLHGDHGREIFGFDTFTGHTGHTPIDGEDGYVQDGAYGCPDGYQVWLEELLAVHGPDATLIAGDVRDTVPAWLAENPALLISLAVFDLDLYEPTRDTLAAIRPHLSPGGIVVFDELGSSKYPGETAALREVWPGLRVRQSRVSAAADGMCYAQVP